MDASKNICKKIDSHCLLQVNTLHIHKVIATVSGGADSVAMLSALCKTGINVVAAHCNFHLRGDESMRDQRHVERICNSLDVPLASVDFDVEAYLNAHKGTSVEMACRNLRHEWFATLMTDFAADRIATGHNADDNIETLFLNLMRGSGTSGLRGMLPDTGKIWRPLLSFHRNEILRYLDCMGIDYVTDSTNLQSDYRRNFLRNEIIPQLRSKWAGFDKALDRSIELLREENKVVTECVEKALPKSGKPLHTDVVCCFPDPELLVRRYIEPLGPFTTTASEVVAAIAADKPSSKIWKLRHGDLMLRNHRLYLRKHGQSYQIVL